jgi:tetratricopeptide (TPR) repeat protein
MTTHGYRSSLAILLILSACGGFRKDLQRGDAFLAKENGSAAMRMYESALQKRPGHPKAELGLARALIYEGEPAGAVELAQGAVDREVDGAIEVLALALLESGQGSQAIPVLEPALVDDPKNPSLHMLQAEAWLAAREIDKALAAAERAFELGGGPQAGSLAGWIHTRKGNCVRARTLAKRASSSFFENARVQAEAASIFRLCGETGSLKATATTARALILDNGENWINSAIRRGNAADQEGALRRLGWLRAMYPNDGLIAREMGLLWWHLGNGERARQEFKAALALPPFYTGGGTQGVFLADRRGDGMSGDERRDAIEKIWDVIIEIHKSENDKVGVAQAIESQLSARRERAPEDYIRLSQAWEKAGDYDKAVEACLKAVKQTTNHMAANTQCAKMYAMLGDLDTAVGHARLAWKQKPEDLELTILLGELYLARNNRREARRIFRIGEGHHPDNPRIQAGLKQASGYGR